MLGGILLALGIGALLIFGIVAPTLTTFVGSELVSTALPSVAMVGAGAFAFYFGGMFASYRAPNRRRLHGVMVGVAAFAISPLVNLGASTLSMGANDPFANLRTPAALLFTGALFVTILLASYVGAGRGKALYDHNQAYVRKRERQQGSKEGS